MQIVINISEELYEMILNLLNFISGIATQAVRDGIPIPKGHGDLIDTNEITAYRELECNGHDVKSLDEFTVIVEADKESEEE